MEKINAEMQKEPNNEYMEIVGHYIIDRCADERVAAAVMREGKTLKGCMSDIQAAARKKAVSTCGVLRDEDVYNAIDAYFAIEQDGAARAEHKRSVDGGATEAPRAKPGLLDITDFL